MFSLNTLDLRIEKYTRGHRISNRLSTFSIDVLYTSFSFLKSVESVENMTPEYFIFQKHQTRFADRKFKYKKSGQNNISMSCLGLQIKKKLK